MTLILGLIQQNIEDPLLDLTSRKDPPLDLTSEELKAPCGNHQEGPTLRSVTWEDFKLQIDRNILKIKK